MKLFFVTLLSILFIIPNSLLPAKDSILLKDGLLVEGKMLKIREENVDIEVHDKKITTWKAKVARISYDNGNTLTLSEKHIPEKMEGNPDIRKFQDVYEKNSNLTFFDNNLIYLDTDLIYSLWIPYWKSIGFGYERMLLSNFLIKISVGSDLFYQWIKTDSEYNGEAFYSKNKEKVVRGYIRFTFNPYRHKQDYLYPISSKFSGWYVSLIYGNYKTHLSYKKNDYHDEYPPAQGEIGPGVTINGNVLGFDIGWKKNIELFNLYFYVAFTYLFALPEKKNILIPYTTTKDGIETTEMLKTNYFATGRILYFGMGYMF